MGSLTSSPLGLTARVAPSWGRQAQGGTEALWGNQVPYGMGSRQMYGAGDRVDAEVGYGPVGARFGRTRLVGISISQYGRDLRMGYPLRLLESTFGREGFTNTAGSALRACGGCVSVRAARSQGEP